MKTRIIQTDFWNDEQIQSLSLPAQHLYLFLLTCPQINICGTFKLSKGVIKLMARLTDAQFESAASELEKSQKVFFYDGYVFVKNARSKNGYENSPKNVLACENELKTIPPEVKTFFNQKLNTTINTSIDSTPKPKIKNQNKGGMGGFDLQIDFLKKLARAKSLVLRSVESELSKWQDYHKAKGTKIKDFEASFRMWIDNAIKWNHVSKVVYIAPPEELAPITPAERAKNSEIWRKELENSHLARKIGLKGAK